jgi:hypothetical protein
MRKGVRPRSRNAVRPAGRSDALLSQESNADLTPFLKLWILAYLLFFLYKKKILIYFHA